MITEEKAKAYDGALATAKRIISNNCSKVEKLCLECVFPELAESEDEMHRKWILEYLYDGLRKSDEQFKGQFKSAIDWLEKQKEEEGYEAIPVESTLEYKLGFKAGKESEKQKEQKILPGFDELTPDEEMSHPLYLKGFDVGRRVQKVFDEQKPAEWSAEDKEMLYAMIDIVSNSLYEPLYPREGMLAWLKSLPERFNLQPKQEWSEEDEKWINYFYSLLGLACEKDIHGLGQKAIDAKMWLKSLRPSWKPSEEQMDALEEVIVLLTNLRRNTGDRKNLESLYEQLKKLM